MSEQQASEGRITKTQGIKPYEVLSWFELETIELPEVRHETSITRINRWKIHKRGRIIIKRIRWYESTNDVLEVEEPHDESDDIECRVIGRR